MLQLQLILLCPHCSSEGSLLMPSQHHTPNRGSVSRRSTQSQRNDPDDYILNSSAHQVPFSHCSGRRGLKGCHSTSKQCLSIPVDLLFDGGSPWAQSHPFRPQCQRCGPWNEERRTILACLWQTKEPLVIGPAVSPSPHGGDVDLSSGQYHLAGQWLCLADPSQ